MPEITWIIMYLTADLYDLFELPANIRKTDVNAVASHQTNKVSKSPACIAAIAAPL